VLKNESKKRCRSLFPWISIRTRPRFLLTGTSPVPHAVEQEHKPFDRKAPNLTTRYL
jgi:hypothetical protein